MCNKKPATAFSLIELLITIAIVGILTTVSYPIYQRHITRTRRSHATVMLFNLAAKMEQYYLEHQTYKNANIATLHIYNDSKYYKLTIATANDKRFLLKAIPINSQAENDKACATLTIDQNNRKKTTGTDPNINCWQ